MLSITSIAGRHQADVRRARACSQHTSRQQDAREELERALRAHHLQVIADWHGASEPALAVKCRLEHARHDRGWIYAALDTLGWQPDTRRLSRINAKYDVLRLRHRDTAAALMLIVQSPCAELVELESA